MSLEHSLLMPTPFKQEQLNKIEIYHKGITQNESKSADSKLRTTDRNSPSFSNYHSFKLLQGALEGPFSLWEVSIEFPFSSKTRRHSHLPS